MRLLNVGCGYTPLAECLSEFTETRVDIVSSCKPDILANMTDLGQIGTYDVVFCCHGIEHLYWHEVPKALSEFKRVLVPEGSLILMVPNLEGVPATDDVLYESEHGPITGLDMIYGLRQDIEHNPYMAHHTGFTQQSLQLVLARAGFRNIMVTDTMTWNLIARGIK